MFSRKLILNLSLVSLLVIPIFLCSSCSKNTPKESVCRIASIEGTVTITREKGVTEAALKGIKLFSGDKLVTASDGSVKLKFRTFATMVLSSDSIYEILEQKIKEDKSVLATSTRLLKGIGLVKVDPSAKTKFTIKTPHVITGVLGTEFGLEVDDKNDVDGDDDDSTRGQTTLAVLSGLVSFKGPGKKLEVGPGCGAKSKGKNPPGLINKFFKQKTKLSKHLQSFIKQEATGETNLSTIFRTY